MKEQEYIIASAASNKDAVDETEIINGIIENSYGLSPRENLFHNYSSEQLYSISKELQNFLGAQGITLNPADNTQILTALKKGILEWNATISYSENDICKIGNTLYISQVDSNLNHNPVGDLTNWGNTLAIPNLSADVIGNLTGTAYGTFKRLKSVLLTSSVSTIDITGLNGDTDIEYEIHAFLNMGATCNVNFQFNNDTGNNYKIAASTTSNFLQAASAITTNYAFVKMNLYSKTGNKRIMIGNSIAANVVASLVGGWWNNTTDNLTSIKFIQSEAATFDAGTRIEIYARR